VDVRILWLRFNKTENGVEHGKTPADKRKH
jgi:hypothetical protein